MSTNKNQWSLIFVASLSMNLASCASAPTIDFNNTLGGDPGATTECVVLLHGLAKSSRSMRKVETALLASGYSTFNVDYPSRKMPVDLLAAEAIPSGVEGCRAQSSGSIHFVTHSMGGILVRQYLAEQDIQQLGRVVMLSPPNQGTVVVDKLEGWPGFARIVGPAGSQLGTDEDSVPRQLPAADFEVGIITGDKSLNLIFSKMIPGEDDSLVSIEAAKIEGMSDFLVIHETHVKMPKSDEAITEVIRFLARGAFGDLDT